MTDIWRNIFYLWLLFYIFIKRLKKIIILLANIHFFHLFKIGERNALLFNQAESSNSEQELPDDFFDLTINDLRALTRDYKRRQWVTFFVKISTNTLFVFF